jgi:hypothetical protein
MLSGERYARLLNASLVVPSCGTIVNEVVRKHFEIPGSKSCLLAPQSPALEAAGFIHMVNCVFTDENSVLDHLDYLFKNPDELHRITLAGYELVHSSHTIQHRDQLYQWFRLHRELRPNQRIVQPGPFESLITTENPRARNCHVSVNGIDRALLKAGYQEMWGGDFAGARRKFLQCVNYQATPEPKLALVILSLLTGDIASARLWCASLLEDVTEETGGGAPDPVEWAFFLWMTLCQGKRREAVAAARKFPRLRHVVLDRVRRFVAEATGNELGADILVDRPMSYSIHELPERSRSEWASLVCMMLRACGQPGMAERITRIAQEGADRSGEAIQAAAPVNQLLINALPKRNSGRRAVKLARRLNESARRYLRRRIKGALQNVEGRVGYFLPYKSSKALRDELFSLVEKLSSEEPVGKVLVIGARRGSYLTEACLSGVRRNPTLPPVMLVNEDDLALNELLKHHSRDPQIVQISKSAKSISDGAGLLLIVDGSELKSVRDYQHHLEYATVVVLDDINDAMMQDLHLSLATNSAFMLIAHNPEHGNGYAILRRKWNMTTLKPEVQGISRQFAAVEHAQSM